MTGGGWKACGGVVGREVVAGGVGCGGGRSPGPGRSLKGVVTEESWSEGA